MGKPFEKIHACINGRIDNAEKIPVWVRANGGAFYKTVTKKVTHLIVSEATYQANGEAVQKAKRIGSIKIVSYDWLEDSLLSRTKRPKPEEPYLWKNLLREQQEKPKPQKSTRDPWAASKVTKGTRARKGKKNSTQPKQKIFTDPETREAWEISIIRACPPRPREKYLLGIFESVAEPHVYSAFARYSRVGKSKIEVLSPPKQEKDIAINAFKDFFLEYTGKNWEDRANGMIPAPKTDKDGNFVPVHEGWYAIENTGNLFTDWMKAYEAPEDVTEDGSAGKEGSDSAGVDASEAAVSGFAIQV